MILEARRTWATLLFAGAAGFASPASAQISDDVVRIGFITDMSGPYADLDGVGGWDYYKVLQTIPGPKAFMTRAESRCALWK